MMRTGRGDGRGQTPPATVDLAVRGRRGERYGLTPAADDPSR